MSKDNNKVSYFEVIGRSCASITRVSAVSPKICGLKCMPLLASIRTLD